VAGRAGWCGHGERQPELVEEIGIRLDQAEGDPARGVIGDDPGGQIAPVRMLDARGSPEDAFVIAGTEAKAELALEAAC
jgi:hypothetical protein